MSLDGWLIKEYLSSTGQPQMTFDQNGPAFFPQASSPMEIQPARLDLRAAAKRLYDLVSGPDEVVAFNTYNITQDLNAFRYVNKYSIASAVPLNGTISYQALASKLSLDSKQLRQMLRHLIQIHVFSEPVPDEGAPARGRGELRTLDRPAYVSVLREARAIGRARAVLAAHDVRKLVSGDGERAGRARLLVGDAGAGSVVVDVAGNVGHCSIPIARANPAVKIVVQDLPKIVARGADPATSVIPAELRHRFTFMEHDFYAPQPVKGAAVYFLRMIMHDYSDAYCLKILRQIVPSMGPDSRIVVMDQVSPPVGLLPSAIERMMRTQDLQMMLLTNARERDVVEWRELVGSVVEDKGEGGEPEQQERQEQNAVPGTTTTARKLEIKTIVSPRGSMMSLIEIGFVDEDAVTTNGAPETNS